MRLLYYSPASYGGLADYAHAQANALVSLGVEVTLLCTPEFPRERGEQYRVVPILKPMQTVSQKLRKAIHYIDICLANYRQLVQLVQAESFQSVLLGSYAEYLAPLWAPSLRQLSRQGVVFGAVIHDPVRDFVLGPDWWHRWSIAEGYSFLREAFVHESIELDTVKKFSNLRVTVIPHGPYQICPPTRSREETRIYLNIPPDANVMLSFGHIRANKNLHLVLQAMVHVPDIYLIVAGKELSSSQNLTAQYQQLAKDLGVDQRCRWEIRFIPDEQVSELFNAADLILLTYSETFHSASGVLNTAVSSRKPCLVSAGTGSLQSTVQTYQLGTWIAPDNQAALVKGLQTWLTQMPEPDWIRFFEENSWKRNAQRVMHAFHP
jgi:glycosyltransferase involved in cell wall biosynthesis